MGAGYVPTTKFTVAGTSAISAIAVRPDGDVAIGTEDDQVFMRDRADLTVVAPGYELPSDGHVFNGDITALAVLSGGDVVIGDGSGYVYVRSGTNLLNTAGGATVDNVNLGVAVTALAVTPDDKVVIGLGSGVVDVRPWDNVASSLTAANFAVAVNALATLSNGDVVIGLANGQVYVRSSLDVANGLVSDADFTGGDPITAVAVTSHDNVVIGTATNLVFVRRADDLALTPEGFAGPDGLNFNAPIGAVAAVAVVPVDCADAIAKGYGLVTDLNDDCYVNWSDFTLFAQNWLRCTDPQDQNCERPWEQ